MSVGGVLCSSRCIQNRRVDCGIPEEKRVSFWGVSSERSRSAVGLLQRIKTPGYHRGFDWLFYWPERTADKMSAACMLTMFKESRVGEACN